MRSTTKRPQARTSASLEKQLRMIAARADLLPDYTELIDAADERKLVAVTLKVSGYIKDLFVDYTGKPVRKAAARTRKTVRKATAAVAA